jgi:hypothetical protein
MMSKQIKDRITDNLEQVKDESKLRSDHIRGHLSDAASLTVAELKEGTAQMRSILKDALAAVIAELKDTGSEIPDKITSSIENAIEESTRYRQQAIAGLQTKLHDIQTQIDQKQRQLDMDFNDTIVDIKATEIEDDSQINAAIDTAINNVKERQVSEMLKQQYLDLKFQLTNLDSRLAARYGDRYAEVKQQLDNIKTLYERSKTEAEVSGVTHIQAKQTQIERKLIKFAAAVAITEQEIVQYLKVLWENKGFDPDRKH